jgi:hypothetical protein
MVKIGTRFKLLEPLPASLLASSSASGACLSEMVKHGNVNVAVTFSARVHPPP